MEILQVFGTLPVYAGFTLKITFRGFIPSLLLLTSEFTCFWLFCPLHNHCWVNGSFFVCLFLRICQYFKIVSLTILVLGVNVVQSTRCGLDLKDLWTCRYAPLLFESTLFFCTCKSIFFIISFCLSPTHLCRWSIGCYIFGCIGLVVCMYFLTSF